MLALPMIVAGEQRRWDRRMRLSLVGGGGPVGHVWWLRWPWRHFLLLLLLYGDVLRYFSRVLGGALRRILVKDVKLLSFANSLDLVLC